MKYRSEIDGLRAVAVFPVILFHAGFELFSGGFVGVDVFFVISGYLITTILIEDIERKQFSIINFYERRIRRILPALFFVMFVCIPFAWMWMLPIQMRDFSQSLVAVSLFSSNILFWRESGYFETVAEEKPLLHTWSLAVEEQYYVLFPIFLILVWKLGKNKVFWMIFIMAVISLLLSELGWRSKADANFYLAPTRAWEILSGSIAAFIIKKKGVEKNDFLALLGLAAIIFSIFVYDKSTPFPSIYALTPVLGTIFIVLYADKETLVAKLLSTKTFVGFGLISYSSYLWHQPLIAFAKIRFEKLSLPIIGVIFILLIFVAYFSWRYVEKPFRNSKNFSKKGIFILSFLGIISFLALGLTGHFLNGKFTKTKYPPNITYQSLGERILNDGLPCSWNSHFNKSRAYDGCIFGDKDSTDNLVLIGDSHSQALSYVIQEWASIKRKKVFWLKMNGCEYFPDVVKNRQPPRVDCNKNHKELINYISSLNADVILIFRWTFRMYPIDGLDLSMPYRNSFGDLEDVKYREYFMYNDGDFVSSYEAKKRFLSKYVKSIANAARTLFLVYPVPETAINIAKRNIIHWRDKNEILSEVFIKEADYQQRNKFVNNVFQELNLKNIIHILPNELFCEHSKCFMQRNGIPLYLDDNHLADHGAQMIINQISEMGQFK